MTSPSSPATPHQAELILTHKGVKPTSNRLLVLRALMQAPAPLSLADLELQLDTLDKSSIYRVLTLLSASHVLHMMEGGDGTARYEVCRSTHHCTPADWHPHFYCVACGRTTCFDGISIPAVQLPEGYHAESVNLMIKGLCPHCAAKA